MPYTVEYGTATGIAKSPTLSVARMPPSQISVLVVGGGPAGAFAALECWRKGHNVRVIERSPFASTQGDFFTITPQIVNQIQKWPEMVEENERIASDPWISYHKFTGELVTGPEPFCWVKPGSITTDESVPSRLYRHNRAKFLQMLLSQLDRIGVTVEYNQRVVQYYEDDKKAGVMLENGQMIEADVVVAADGIGTKSHKLINGRDIRARSSGWGIFRTAFPVEAIVGDQELNDRFKILDNGHPRFELWRGLSLSLAILRTGDTVSWSMQHKDNGTATESWNRSVGAEEVIKALSEDSEFPDIGKRLIRATPDGHIVDWKLMLRDTQPNTVSPLGRVVQVGDAAHTFLPSSGSGANQGMEDGIYLAACLQLGGRNKIRLAMNVYNRLRFERVSCCQKFGFFNLQRQILGIKVDPTDVRTEHGQWIWRHDPEDYVYSNYKAALKHIEHGADFQSTNIPTGHVYEPWTVDELMDTVERGEPVRFDGDWS